MSKIHVLPEILANKIAAGEVIERPASIVKELIENSLDAGARSIDVTVKHGGKSLIRIADDGNGMNRDDVELAFQRHATSKISSVEDLAHIMSYGFRGEALPSIAAVSRVQVRTRAKEEDSGTALMIEGGHITQIESCSCRAGTIIEVRDLFFNTPARRKFLRTDATEMRYVMESVSHVALAASAVALSLTSNDQEVWRFIADEPVAERARAVLGLDDASILLPVASEENGIRLSGLIAKPHAARSNRTGQAYYINRRWIKSLPLSYAVLNGYHGLLMQGQYPLAVLFLELDPVRIDVNVHPTKQEVRISNEREVKSLLMRTVADRLRQDQDLAPHMTLPREVTLPPGEHGKSSVPVQRQTSGQWTPVDLQPFRSFQAMEPLAEPIALRNHLQITRILGQVHQTYIIAETETGLIIVDQHAAHERVMFEELLSDLRSGLPRRQGLLLSTMLQVTIGQEDLLQRELPFLQKLGFDIELFGEREFVVRAVPATLSQADPIPVLKQFLEQRESEDGRTDLEEHDEELAALIACKRKSVKAHDRLSPEKTRALLEQLSRCDNPYNCPHGRPAFFQYSLADLEKQFKRTL